MARWTTPDGAGVTDGAVDGTDDDAVAVADAADGAAAVTVAAAADGAAAVTVAAAVAVPAVPVPAAPDGAASGAAVALGAADVVRGSCEPFAA